MSFLRTIHEQYAPVTQTGYIPPLPLIRPILAARPSFYLIRAAHVPYGFIHSPFRGT